MIRTRHYVNLSNGLEALPGLVASGESWGVMRLRSTTVERKDWVALLLTDVSDDLLLHLALGWRCVLHDRGTNRPMSKTCYYAVPLVRYLLDRRWYGAEPTEVWKVGRRGGPGCNVVTQFAKIYHDLFAHASADGGRVKRRIEYFRRYLRPGATGVLLETACQSTSRDGDRDYHAHLARISLPNDT